MTIKELEWALVSKNSSKMYDTIWIEGPCFSSCFLPHFNQSQAFAQNLQDPIAQP